MKSIHLLYATCAAIPLVLSGCAIPGDRGLLGAGESPTEYFQEQPASSVPVSTRSAPLEINAPAVAIIEKHPATPGQRAAALQRGWAWSAHHGPGAGLDRHRPYIAVDTRLNSRSSLYAQRAVMIFDTRDRNVIGGRVYDIETPPPVGTIARFDNHTALYIGAGY